MISPQISEQASAQQMADTIFLRPVVTSMIAQAEPGCADLLSRSGLLPSTQKSKAKSKMSNKHGGRRVGAGRPLGSVNRATVDAKARLSELARQHCGLALDVLARIAENGQSETARIAAACALLDRGFGKPREASVSEYSDPEDSPFGWLGGIR